MFYYSVTADGRELNVIDNSCERLTPQWGPKMEFNLMLSVGLVIIVIRMLKVHIKYTFCSGLHIVGYMHIAEVV